MPQLPFHSEFKTTYFWLLRGRIWSFPNAPTAKCKYDKSCKPKWYRDWSQCCKASGKTHPKLLHKTSLHLADKTLWPRHLYVNCRTFFHKAHVVLNKHECDRKLPQEPNSKPEFNHKNGYSVFSCNTFTFSKLPIFKQRSMHGLAAQCHTRERDILCVTPRKATSWGSNLCKFHSNIFCSNMFFSFNLKQRFTFWHTH